MQNRVFDEELVNRVVDELNITDLENATIGEVLMVARSLEEITSIPFIRMDQGVPGLAPCKIGIEAEKEALDRGVAAIYPPAEGVDVLKNEAARFVKAFLDVEMSANSIIPVTGSVGGSFGSFIACNQIDPKRDTVLFIDPGFPIQKSQLKIVGIKYEYFDIYDFRGELLKDRLEGYLAEGNISTIIYSNPNNPAWICLTEDELRIIGQLATKYDAIVMEDLAYLGMDFRDGFGRPFEPPYIPTVAKYTDNYILMISSSKIFSYAGQRAAIVCLSDKLAVRRFDALAERYSGSGLFGQTLTASILYMITSGITHSTQYGFAAMLKAANDGEYNFVEETREYATRAKRMKETFKRYGFNVVYDRDLERPISDGFFFTIGYKDMSGGELMRNLLYYGISSIALSTTGSEQEGVRACSSQIESEQFAMLDQRLRAFAEDNQ